MSKQKIDSPPPVEWVKGGAKRPLIDLIANPENPRPFAADTDKKEQIKLDLTDIWRNHDN
ncbi:MAG: hypothetical protein GW903_07935 [Alphaproteobacteria bacterium]|nr:hypothetical protein [Alphaproteobacteria bacterium]NCQ89190.1 hypothetical protein [Alphaproteobacteria bacterium]